jgi:hypothetical protein
MKVKLTNFNCKNVEQKEEIVLWLSRIIEAPNLRFEPYKPNENDGYFWTLDAGNNWKVQFDENEPDVLNISHRYQCTANQFEEALVGWLKFKSKITEIDNTK